VIHHRPIEIYVVVDVCDVGMKGLWMHCGITGFIDAAQIYSSFFRCIALLLNLLEFLCLHFHDKSERLGQEKLLLGRLALWLR